MEPLKAVEIRGNWATLLIPINNDDSINYQCLSATIDTLIAMQVNGIYSNGTAGEFYNQTEDEFDTISQLLAHKCNAARMPFQIGACHTSPVMARERVKRAAALQPGAIQVILPDWSAPSMPEVINYLRVLTEVAAPVPLVLYNPPHAKKRLIPEEFFQLKEAGINLAGCKTVGGEAQWYIAMKKWAPELSLFVPGHHLATGVSLGAHGAYSNVACIHPVAAQLWYNLMLTNMPKALHIEKGIQLFMSQYIQPFISTRGYSNQAADKLLAAIGGWSNTGTRLRWPYIGIDDSEVAKLRPIAHELMPEFFALPAEALAKEGSGRLGI
ncbi:MULTISPECIES: dihydrodipicolinate synthase family protein [Niastella]|uniref:Dihydrodipicolinate synthase family protein n=1 Tax=Niastella soli TaxID=2821487 RepID=A0ABS3Z421_9BACT|nr:dihydrodipicolinate synthase family protein [Niastella soli]MBO9204879.1 dihydrodipicolinate synthase family protein [Niastella soli]